MCIHAYCDCLGIFIAKLHSHVYTHSPFIHVYVSMLILVCMHALVHLSSCPFLIDCQEEREGEKTFFQCKWVWLAPLCPLSLLHKPRTSPHPLMLTLSAGPALLLQLLHQTAPTSETLLAHLHRLWLPVASPAYLGQTGEGCKLELLHASVLQRKSAGLPPLTWKTKRLWRLPLGSYFFKEHSGEAPSPSETKEESSSHKVDLA